MKDSIILAFRRKNKGMTKIDEKISSECIDLNAHCEMWEKLGHCIHSAKYMNHYCRKSCGFCDREERSEIGLKIIFFNQTKKKFFFRFIKS
jgi:hypothetical protein